MYTINIPVQSTFEAKPPTPTHPTYAHTHTHIMCSHTKTYDTNSETSPLRALSLLQRFQVKSTCTLSYTHTSYTYIQHTHIILYTHKCTRTLTCTFWDLPKFHYFIERNKNEQNKYWFNLEPSSKVSTSEEETITGLYPTNNSTKWCAISYLWATVEYNIMGQESLTISVKTALTRFSCCNANWMHVSLLWCLPLRQVLKIN